ncbi:hypothetical protein N665_1073s0013 [Sinapis alba]|nr:hypothetical protein N665_1073s0013 [Sinapis alba]
MSSKETTLSSLPDEMVINCLAHISKSYYPKLCLVSKRFHSLILSMDLVIARYHLKKQEYVLEVCLQLPGHRLPSWFSLWIKPDQILTNKMEEEENNKPSGNTLLVAKPSSYSPNVPVIYHGMIGSKHYAVKDCNTPTSSPMRVRNEGTRTWREAPSMKVARDKPVVGILDGKIYIMGGCSSDECTNWAEVFDPQTQTWESLPDPGAELRFSLIKSLKVTTMGKVHVRSSAKNEYYYYDPKEGKWGVLAKAPMVERTCLIENVSYMYREKDCLWYDTKRQEWRVVKGLEVLNKNCCAGAIALVNYCGKLLILWDKFEQPGQSENKNIWCSVIALERGNGDDEVWGNVEWASVVLTVPSSYVFFRCRKVSF